MRMALCFLSIRFRATFCPNWRDLEIVVGGIPLDNQAGFPQFCRALLRGPLPFCVPRNRKGNIKAHCACWVGTRERTESPIEVNQSGNHGSVDWGATARVRRAVWTQFRAQRGSAPLGRGRIRVRWAAKVPRARARSTISGRKRVARGSGAHSNFLAKAEIGRAIGILTDESARRP